jgi:hypothetical protein
MDYGHIMVDIETMGNGSGAALVQLSAQEFNLETGALGRSFDQRVSLQSSLNAGLKVTASTIQWWMSQPDEARQRLFQDPQDLRTVLTKFALFVVTCGGDKVYMWGNSPRFDEGIIADAFRAVNMGLPWNFRMERCVRTISALAPQVRQNEPLPAVQHDGIEDARYQISYLVKVMKHLALKMK